MDACENKSLLCRGFSLIEVVVAMVFLSVIAIGSLSYEYHSMLHARIAKADIAATQLGQLILEDWRSTGGSASYDPSSTGLSFVTLDGPNNQFLKVVDGISLEIIMSHSDVDVDSETGVILRQLNVVVDWVRNNQQDDGDKPTLAMTSYVRLDAGGG